MITVRRPEPQDCSAVLARAFATSFAVEQAAFEQSFHELRAEPDTFLAVADADGIVAGYLLGFDHRTFYANGRVAWVEEITAGEAFRRQSIGRRLMEAFEAWAAGREVKQIALATRRAAEFYQSLGYADSAVYFRKRL